MSRKKTVKKTSRARRSSRAKHDVISTSGSYTNLVYGIITVGVVFAVILLALKLISPKHKSGQITDQAAKTSVHDEKIAVQVSPNSILTPTSTITPTENDPTPTVLNPSVTPTPSLAVNSQKTKPGVKEYTVQENDSLWSIAEKTYKSGYNWVSIAKANNITNPEVIYKGTKIMLPDVTPIMIAQEKPTQNSPPSQIAKPNTAVTSIPAVNKITGDTYTIAHGDDLWNIAVRAYGDGYKWTQIAKANNLSNPGLIFSGNIIKIPRS